MMTTKQIFKKAAEAISVLLLSMTLGFGVSILTTPDPFKVTWNGSVGTVKTDIRYDTGEKHTFDLYLPADKSKPGYGLVIYLHAGGFTTGDKSDDTKLHHYFTAKGYVSAGINYSLRTEQSAANVLQMSNEIKTAIAKVVEQARAEGYNVDRMAVMGGSAGGALAMIYAYRDGKDAPVPIKFVMYQVAPSGFEPADWYGLDQDASAAAAWVSVMTGTATTPQMIENGEYQALLKPISGYAWVSEHSPPTLCAFGKLDKVVPFATTKRLFHALEKYQVPHDCYVFEKSGHGLHRDKHLSEQFTQSLNNYLNKYLQ